MSYLVEIMKKIGIFMIAAQAITHFAPSQKYEKYLKLMVGMMILVQLVMPIHTLSGESLFDWSTALENMEITNEDLGQMDFLDRNDIGMEKQVLATMENEIKSKLNNEIGEDYIIQNVIVSISSETDSSEKDNIETKKIEENAMENQSESTGKYELDLVTIEVQEKLAEDIQTDRTQADVFSSDEAVVDTVAIEKVRIEQVSVEKAGTRRETGAEEEQKEELEETEAMLRQKFGRILGISEEVMEVIVHGADEENDS